MISIIIKEGDMTKIDIKIIEVKIGEMMIMFMEEVNPEDLIENLIGIIKENNIIPIEEVTSQIEKIITEIMETEEIKMIEEAETINFRIIVNSKILGLVGNKDKMI